MPEANSFSDAGPDLWECLGWQPNDTQLSQLKELQALLRHWNSRVNLTRLVENEEFWISQVFDSLWLSPSPYPGPHSPLLIQSAAKLLQWNQWPTHLI